MSSVLLQDMGANKSEDLRKVQEEWKECKATFSSSSIEEEECLHSADRDAFAKECAKKIQDIVSLKYKIL